MEDKNRFKDANIRLGNFADIILVQCPKCQQCASVSGGFNRQQANLQCNHCKWHQKKDYEIFDLTHHRNCDSCGQVVELYIPNVKKKKETIKSKCPHCEQTREVEPQYTYALDAYFNTLRNGTDPHFQLPYWLSKPVKGKLFWALNFDHLAYLKKYIQAKVRERNNRAYFTMIERLPQFIKAAKNRTALIKCIEALEKK